MLGMGLGPHEGPQKGRTRAWGGHGVGAHKARAGLGLRAQQGARTLWRQLVSPLAAAQTPIVLLNMALAAIRARAVAEVWSVQ